MTARRSPSTVSALAMPLLAVLALAVVAGCGRSHVVVRPEHRQRPATARPATPPRPGATVVVRKGETVYRIATRHGVSPLDLAVWNRIPPPYTIYPGQRLRLTPPTPPRNDVRPPPRVAATPPRPQTGPQTPPSATRPATPARPQPGPQQGPQPAPPAAAAQFEWRWPADGALVTRYAPGDPTRQGIDIAGKSGAPVRAAADGVVVYSGAGLVGYGELIIVKHDEQWLSAYGHNRARLVNEGQRVKAGEQIAEMGRSGASREMLHFEIRYNGKPQDPLLSLPKR
ncbi:MAG: peptidoglycan DD-metalloendopeptidase family protein [Pseudomonadota bacterium]